jgi:hypothetical protein
MPLSKGEEVCKRSRTKAFHLYQTQHTYARIVAEEIGSFVEMQEALGHGNVTTTKV